MKHTKQSFFSRFFPAPKFLRLNTVGLDLSDANVRMMELSQTPAGLLPKRFFEVKIPEGMVEGGKIIDEQKLSAFLKELKRKHSIRFARVSISEPQIYSFTVSIDAAAGSDIREAVEFILEEYIPLKVSESVFDCEVVATTDIATIVQVTAMNASASQTYLRVLESADIVPTAFELEGQALARALIVPQSTGSSMIVDFGAHRTGVAIVSNGVVVYTSTIDFGGNHITQAVANALHISTEEAEAQKRSIGLGDPHGHETLFEALSINLNVLKEEINRRYIYWHEKRAFPELFSTVERILLTGGDSNLQGIDDYLRAALRLPVEIANPWANCFEFDDAIPPLTHAEALSYTTAIGLALADMPRRA